jgi:FMN phosphatase YigB (HAD superfamily)
MSLACVFFDVGSTLGMMDSHLHLQLYAGTIPLLTSLRELDLRLGVISNVPPSMTNTELVAVLDEAKLLEFFEPALIVASRGLDDVKPAPAIYQRAAALAGVPIEQCLFVGEDLTELIGAQAAGMTAQHKPRP